MTDIVLEIIGLKSDDSTGNNDTVSARDEGQTAVIYLPDALGIQSFYDSFRNVNAQSHPPVR